jgi:hypothetical protein
MYSKEKSVEHKIVLEDKFITNLNLDYKNNGEVLSTGFYSVKSSESEQVRGSFYQIFNSRTGKIRINRTNDIGLESLMFDSLKFKDKGKIAILDEKERLKDIELKNFELKTTFTTSDSGTVQIAENYNVQLRSSTMGGGVGYRYNPNLPNGTPYGYGAMEAYQTSSYSYGANSSKTGNNKGYFQNSTGYHFFGDIFIIKTNSKGELEWVSTIRKSQFTFGIDHLKGSYALSIVGDKLYFIYNDHHKNYGTNNTSRHTTKCDIRSLVSLSIVDKFGKVSTRPFYENKQMNIITQPKLCRQISSNELLIFGEGEDYKSYRIGKVIFAE